MHQITLLGHTFVFMITYIFVIAEDLFFRVRSELCDIHTRGNYLSIVSLRGDTQQYCNQLLFLFCLYAYYCI